MFALYFLPFSRYQHLIKRWLAILPSRDMVGASFSSDTTGYPSLHFIWFEIIIHPPGSSEAGNAYTDGRGALCCGAISGARKRKWQHRMAGSHSARSIHYSLNWIYWLSSGARSPLALPTGCYLTKMCSLAWIATDTSRRRRFFAHSSKPEVSLCPFRASGILPRFC